MGICSSNLSQTHSSFDEHVSNGILHHQLGNLETAIRYYTKALQLNPDDDIVLNSRGIAYEKQGKLDAAISDFNEAIRINPESTVALYNRAKIYQTQNKLDEAIKGYRETFNINPQDFYVLDKRINPRPVRDLEEAIEAQENHLRP